MPSPVGGGDSDHGHLDVRRESPMTSGYSTPPEDIPASSSLIVTDRLTAKSTMDSSESEHLSVFSRSSSPFLPANLKIPQSVDDVQLPEELFFKAIDDNNVPMVRELLGLLSLQPLSTKNDSSHIPRRLANVNVRNEQGLTALHICALRGYDEITQILLELRVDVTAGTRHGTTALYLACQYNHIQVVRLLLSNSSTHVNQTDLNRNTPLHATASNGHFETLQILLAHGADVSAANNRGETSLHLASRWGYAALVEKLVEAGADVNARTDVDGATPLHMALDSETIKYLVRRGAFVNAEDDEGFTALHRAARQGNLERVELLWSLGASVDARDKGNRTALHSAACDGHVAVLSFLIDICKADVNALSTNGNSPLHAGVSNGHANVTELLLQRGANRSLRNRQSKLAEDMTQSDIIKNIFRKHGGLVRRLSLFGGGSTLSLTTTSPTTAVTGSNSLSQ